MTRGDRRPQPVKGSAHPRRLEQPCALVLMPRPLQPLLLLLLLALVQSLPLLTSSQRSLPPLFICHATSKVCQPTLHCPTLTVHILTIIQTSLSSTPHCRRHLTTVPTSLPFTPHCHSYLTTVHTLLPSTPHCSHLTTINTSLPFTPHCHSHLTTMHTPLPCSPH